ncbi:MAG: CbiX/SirB N-terminal domain-containing protein [Acidobacteria bacterium]|nr:CbiX/SirB N-terminal domain-containing protein [Acidobacteriota bacterium]
MKTGFILFAHGSPVESANEAVRAVARRVGAEVAFLEPYHPTLGETIANVAGAGVNRMVVIPYFLMLGLHLERDLPRIVAAAARVHPDVEIRVTPPLDGHPALALVVLDRAAEAVAEWLESETSTQP